MKVAWDIEKNKKLKIERNIGFEDVEVAILEDRVLDIVPHFNQNKYPNQEILIVEINNYIYYVPFAMDGDELFLKTVIPTRKLNKLYGRFKMKLDGYEKEVIGYIENTNPESIKNIKDRTSKIKEIVTHSTTKRRQINIRLLENDIEKLKSKALEEGIPYQTLINSVVHKYANGLL